MFLNYQNVKISQGTYQSENEYTDMMPKATFLEIFIHDIVMCNILFGEYAFGVYTTHYEVELE